MVIITILIFSSLLLLMVMRQNRRINRLDSGMNNLKNEVSLIKQQVKNDPEAEVFGKKCLENFIRGGS